MTVQYQTRERASGRVHGSRMLLYSADASGIGGIRRTLAIARELNRLRPDAALLAVTGSHLTGSFPLPSSFDFIKLPNATMSTLYRGLGSAPGEDHLGIWQLRSRLIAESAAGFMPHLVLIDAFPAGIEGEAVAALRLLHQMTPRPRIVLGLRDVIDDRENARRSWHQHGVDELLDEVFDDILVYGTRDLYDHVEELAFSERAAAKTVFCGYIRQPETIELDASVRARPRTGSGPLVVVAAGGGEFGHHLMSTYLDALHGGHLNGIASCLLTGPLMHPGSRERIEAMAAGLANVALIEFASEPLRIYNAADVVVTMGGSTMVEAVGLGKRVVSAPWVHKFDQVERGRRFGERGLVTYLPPAELDAVRLAAAIKTALAGPPPPAILPFTGLEVAGPILAAHLP